jgi:membrane protein implicated in regulation of membrane protease activity
MLNIYLVSALVGCALIILSLVTGHHDGDFGGHEIGGHEIGGHEFGGHEIGGHEVGGHDVGGHDVDAHGGLGHDGLGHDVNHSGYMAGIGTWIPFFSLRFWTYFAAGFGVTGVLLTFLTKGSVFVIPWIALVTGFMSGLAVATMYRFTQISSSDSMTREKDILGREAKVLVAVRPDQPGRVRCNVKGDLVDYMALPHDGSSLEVGDDAVIVAMENGKAMVIPKSEIFD